MKRFTKLFALLATVVLMGSSAACSKVAPGEGGILVATTGDRQNPAKTQVVHGRVWYNPITHDLHTFPTRFQTVQWGEDGQDSLSFSTGKDNAPIKVAVGFSLSVTRERIPYIYFKHYKGMEDLTNTYVKTAVRGALNAAAASRNAQDVVGSGRTAFQQDVEQRVRRQLGAEGFDFGAFEILGNPSLPANVQRSINLALEATQKAQIAENQLREVRAQAAKQVAEAEGQSQAQLIRTQGEAERRIINARSEAEANRLRSSTLTDLIIRDRAVAKWDGKFPQTMAGNGLQFFNQIR